MYDPSLCLTSSPSNIKTIGEAGLFYPDTELTIIIKNGSSSSSSSYAVLPSSRVSVQSITHSLSVCDVVPPPLPPPLQEKQTLSYKMITASVCYSLLPGKLSSTAPRLGHAGRGSTVCTIVHQNGLMSTENELSRKI